MKEEGKENSRRGKVRLPRGGGGAAQTYESARRMTTFLPSMSYALPSSDLRKERAEEMALPLLPPQRIPSVRMRRREAAKDVTSSHLTQWSTSVRSRTSGI